MKSSTFLLPSEPNETRLIRIGKVMLLTGLSRSYIYFLSAEGRFPKSISLVPGGTSRAWIFSEVINWVEERIAERDQETGNE
jgi:prophage regulatory protein